MDRFKVAAVLLLCALSVSLADFSETNTALLTWAFYDHPLGSDESVGVELAQQRRSDIFHSILNDPAAALQASRELSAYDLNLPQSVKSLLEEQFSGTADLQVLARLYEDGTEDHTATLTFTNGATCEVVLYGARSDLITTSGLSVNGILLCEDGRCVCAVYDTPALALTPSETVKYGYPADTLAALVAGEVRTFDSEAAYSGFVEQLEQNERLSQVTSPSLGQGTILAVILHFAGQTQSCFDAAGFRTKYTNIEDFFRASTFGRLTQKFTITADMALPKDLAYYQTAGYGQVQSDANALLAAKGISTSGYTNIQYVFPRISAWGWAGLGTVGGGTTWINDCNTGDWWRMCVSHELGHNLGLHHAGMTSTYDDPWAIMGNMCTGFNCTFQASHKEKLKWIDTTTVKRFTSASEVGTQRVTLSNVRNPAKPASQVYLLELPSATAGTVYTVEHADFMGTTTCCVRTRTTSLGSTTKILAKLATGQSWTASDIGVTVTCESKAGTYESTSATVLLSNGGPNPTPAASASPSTSRVPASASPSTSRVPASASPSSSRVPASASPSSRPASLTPATSLKVSVASGSATFSWVGDTRAVGFYVAAFDYTTSTTKEAIPTGYLWVPISACPTGSCSAKATLSLTPGSRTFWWVYTSSSTTGVWSDTATFM